MDANWWPWIAVIDFLIFCCIPMLFTGKHDESDEQNETRKRTNDAPAAKTKDRI